MKKILLGVFIALILLVGGCFALVGGALNAADEAAKEEERNDRPTAVAEGKAFSHDDFAPAAGWKVTKEFGGVTIAGLTVTNRHEDVRSALFTFTFVKGDENLAEVECTSNELQSGQKSKMDCVSFDQGFPTGYTEIQVADMF